MDGKIDGIQRIRMEDFRLLIENMGLVDLKLYGTKYTWTNRQIGGRLIM